MTQTDDIHHSLQTGITFGLTSGIITTLGLTVGLHAGTQSRVVVLGGILTIAIADAFSDALGIHVSEEAENIHSPREIWIATSATFASKFFCALSFAVPLLLLPLPAAIWLSMGYGLSLLALLSFLIAREQGSNPLPVVGEHLGIAVVVIGITHGLGRWISSWTG